MIRCATQIIDRNGGESRREAELRATRKCLEVLGIDRMPTHTDSGAPILPGVAVSVSHSERIACVAISSEAGHSFGIDVEDSTRAQLAKVAPRFLSGHELTLLDFDSENLCKAWTAKEAVFKAIDKEGVDFAKDIRLSLPNFDTAEYIPENSLFSLSFYNMPFNNIICIAQLCNNSQTVTLFNS